MIGEIPNYKQDLLKQFGEEYIFKSFISGFKQVGKPFKSELRADNNASAIINYYEGSLIYTDFGNGDRLNCFDYVMRKHNCNFGNALSIIDKYCRVNNTPIIINNAVASQANSVPSHIHVNCRLWCSKDGKFWNKKYGISLNTLNKYRVYPISWYLINGNKFIADELAYAYYFGQYESIERYKIYQPYGDFKWCSNTQSNLIQGYDQLDHHDLLILTKSLKDVMVLNEVGFNACSLQAESIKLTKDHLDRLYFKTNYKRIITLYDNDDAGIKYAGIIKNEYGIQSLFFPEGTKDASEFSENYSLEGLREYVESNLSL